MSLNVPQKTSTKDYQMWSNWAGNIQSTPAITVQAHTEEDVVDAVKQAREIGLSARVCGSSLSFSPLVATGGMLLNLLNLTGITAIDPARGRVRVRAGTTIRQFVADLWDRGFALLNQGIIWNQTIGGALATSTHGTGQGLQGMSSMVTWVRLVDGRGEVVEIGEDDPDRLHAAQTSLGVMGVFLEIELKVVPRFFLEERLVFVDWDEAQRSWDSDVAANRNHAVMWLQSDTAAREYNVPTPEGKSLANSAMFMQFNPIDPIPESEWCREVGARRGPSYFVLSAENTTNPFFELEYMIPVDKAHEAIRQVQDLMRGEHANQVHPMFIRFVKGDEAWMSPFYERDTVTVSVAGHPGVEYWPYLRDVDRTLKQFEARAHWGKLHLMTREYLEAVYPRHGDFVRVRREIDPDGIFLNDHTRPLVG